jgi:hypothetical protein
MVEVNGSGKQFSLSKYTITDIKSFIVQASRLIKVYIIGKIHLLVVSNTFIINNMCTIYKIVFSMLYVDRPVIFLSIKSECLNLVI